MKLEQSQRLRPRWPVLRALFFVLMLVAGVGPCGAQNLPPPGAYQPIPNFTGVGAGLQFREAINDRFSGAQPIAPSITSPAFANLPPEQDGMLLFCKDCRSATPCASGGGGAWALGTRGQWACASAALEAALNANGNKVSNLASATVNGDALAFGQTGAQLNTLSGSKLDGSDAIANLSLNGVLNATDFRVVCSDTTASATTTSGNATVAVGAIGDFKVGQYVKLDAAGTSNTIATPAIASATNDGYNFNYLPDPTVLDLPRFGSNVTANGHCTADAGTANNHNTSCSTSYCYSVQNVGQTGIGAGLNGMRSAASTPVCDTTAPATPSVGNAILVTYSVDANTAGTIVRRCTGASCTPTSIYAVVPNPPGLGSTSARYRDEGFPYGIDEEASTSAVAADLDAQITAIAGSSVTLSVAPSQTTTATMRHDNAPALQAAVNASILQSTIGSKVYLPSCAAHYDMAQAVSFWGLAQTGIQGPITNASTAQSGTLIQWDGPPGGIVFNLNYATGDTIAGIGAEGLTGSTPGILIDENRYGTYTTPSSQGPGAPSSSAAAGSTPTKLEVRHVDCGVVGLCLDLGGAANDEDAVVDDLQCSTPNGVGGEVCIYSNSQETYNEAFYNVGCSSRDYCFDFFKIGSFTMLNTNSENAGILYRISQETEMGRSIGGQEEGAQFFQYGGPGVNAVLTFSDWRVAGGSGPWATVIFTNGGLASYLNMNFDGAGAATSSNIVGGFAAGTFINDFFSTPLSFLGVSGEWGGGTVPFTPGGGGAASPYFLPITDSNGSGIPAFTCIHCGINGQTIPGIVSNEPNQATAFNSAPVTTTLTGTSGSAVCSQSMQGTLKTATCYLNAYQQTGTAQTYAYPAAFSTSPNLLASCGTYEPASTASTLALPANASMAAETCNITAIGQ